MTEIVMRDEIVYDDSVQIQIKSHEFRYSKSFTVKGIDVAEAFGIALDAYKKENIEIRRYKKHEKTIKPRREETKQECDSEDAETKELG